MLFVTAMTRTMAICVIKLDTPRLLTFALEPLCVLFGATEDILPYAMDYGRIISYLLTSFKSIREIL